MDVLSLYFIQVVEMNMTVDSASKQLIPFVYFMVLGLILLCVEGHCDIVCVCLILLLLVFVLATK